MIEEVSINNYIALCNRYIQEWDTVKDEKHLSDNDTELLKQVLGFSVKPIEIVENGELQPGEACCHYDDAAFSECLDNSQTLHLALSYIISFQDIADERDLYLYISKLPDEIIDTLITDKHVKHSNYVLRCLCPNVKSFIKELQESRH